MAESVGVRKSTRTRKRQSYLEDDFQFDLTDIDLEVSTVHSKPSTVSRKSRGSAKEPQANRNGVQAQQIDNHEDANCNSDSNLQQGGVGTSGSHSLEQSVFVATENLTCSLCHRHLATEEELEAHIEEHRLEGTQGESGLFKCDICETVCSDVASYNSHMKIHTDERSYQCDYCEKSFTGKFGLKRHMKTHMDVRPFVCDICFKSFVDRGGFMRHKRIHTNMDRAYSCSMCEKSFKDRQGLKRHEKTHTGLRPYLCKVCGKSFVESGSFRRHEKIHIGVKKYSCWRCERRFLEKQSLVRHLKHVCGFGDGSFNVLEETCDEQAMERLGETDNTVVTGEGLEGEFNGREDLKPSDAPHVSSHIAALFNSGSLSGGVEGPNQVDASSCPPTDADVPCVSLRTLINKDPNLIDGISEIVDSIDSYEKMFDLCGDKGQREIDAALTRAPDSTPNSESFPDNLLCFECGELLVDGENFKTEGRTYTPDIVNSFKCLACEEEDDDSLDLPGLTAEVSFEVEMSEGEVSDTERPANGHAGEDSKDLDQEEEQGSDCSASLSGKNELQTEQGQSNSTDRDNLSFEASKPNGTTMNCIPYLQSTDSHQIPYLESSSETGSKPSGGDGQNLVATRSSTSIDSTLASADSIYQHQMQQQPEVGCLDYEVADPNIPTAFPCHHCSKVFSSAAFLNQHMRLHKAHPFKCDICNKGFTNMSGLRRHRRVHTGEKPYSCPRCFKQFRDPSNYSKHKRMCRIQMSQLAATEGSTELNASIEEDGALMSQPSNTDGTFSKDSQSSLRMRIHLSETGDNWASLTSRREVTAGADNASHEVEAESSQTSKPFLLNQTKHADVSSPVSPEDAGVTETSIDFQNYVECEICLKVCSSASHLEQHMIYHKGDPDRTCIECGKTFSDAFNLKRHMRIHASVRPHHCEYCGRGYCDAWSFRKHQARGCHKDEVKVPVDLLYPCPNCKRVFSEEDYLAEHSKQHSGGDPEFACDICGKTFSESFNLKRHRRLHMAVCTVCDEEFPDLDALSAHRVNGCKVALPALSTQEADDKKFPCSECGRSYSTKAYLDRHKKFHTKVKSHVCQICAKKFSEAFKLRRHMKVHTGNKQHICTSCGKGFYNSASLRRHANLSCKLVAGAKRIETDYPCNLCDKIFSKKHLLVRHMNVHSQERPYECDQCGRTYKDTSSLRRHQLVHEGVKEQVCPRCGKDFYYSDSLRRHMEGHCGGKKKKKKKNGDNVVNVVV